MWIKIKYNLCIKRKHKPRPLPFKFYFHDGYRCLCKRYFIYDMVFSFRKYNWQYRENLYLICG